MAKFKITMVVEHNCGTLSTEDKDYLREYAVSAIQTMHGSYYPDDLASVIFGDDETKITCKELKDYDHGNWNIITSCDVGKRSS